MARTTQYNVKSKYLPATQRAIAERKQNTMRPAPKADCQQIGERRGNLIGAEGKTPTNMCSSMRRWSMGGANPRRVAHINDRATQAIMHARAQIANNAITPIALYRHMASHVEPEVFAIVCEAMGW